MADRVDKAEEAPLVSVCCITYNHKDYIRQAIDSFLMEKTDFPIEIIINDDASTDGTTDIIREYQKKFPNIIKPVYHRENEYSKGIRGILARNLIPIASGKYIALCEGDDYWTDPLKLQRQVDFFESHTDYTVCYHRVEELSEADGRLYIERLNTEEQEQTYTIYDLAKQNIMHTPSVMYRKGGEALPDWVTRCPVGDYPLHMNYARSGKIKYLPEAMAVYRRHQTSTWSSMDSIPRIAQWLIVLRCVIQAFHDNQEVKAVLQQQLLERYNEFYLKCMEAKEYERLDSLTSELFLSSADFTALWYDKFYLPQRKILSSYPVGVKKSIGHLIRTVSDRLK